jgi:hypothetical protein
MRKDEINSQEKYILDELNSFFVCKISNKYTNNIDEVSMIKNILNEKFINGIDMNTLLCLFDTLLLSSTKKKSKYGLYYSSTKIKEWIKKMETINVKSSEGFIYIANILSSDIKVIIKIPKYINKFNDIIREYFIGITEINKLRFFIPNFVYTLGGFMSKVNLIKKEGKKDEETVCLVYEKIPGNTIQYMLKNELLTFDQFLGIFIQILIALEVGQNKIRFCHFDLHTNNVMSRPVKNLKYSVMLYDKIYDITAIDYLPIIIDYGMTSVFNKNKTVGSYTFDIYGMMNYLVQGYDMYKFLIYSIFYAKNNVQRQIIDLLLFYGKNDPYKILIKGEKGIDKATSEFTKKVTFSKIASFTPLQYINWITEKSEYKHITNKYIKEKNRDIYINLHHIIKITQYDNIFKNYEYGIIETQKLLEDYNLKNNGSSYVITKYTMMILKAYNLNTPLISDQIKKLNMLIKLKGQEMINYDIETLNTYIKIKLQSEEIINKYCNKILNIKILPFIEFIKDKKITNDIITISNKFLNIVTFYKKIFYYIQFIYTIKEINSEYIFKKYLDVFYKSEHFTLFNKYNFLIEKTIRWNQTLLNAFKIKN